MSFVNEFVSEEDIKRYNLIEMWFEYHWGWKKENVLPDHVRLYWTIDRERDIYFMLVSGLGYDKDFITCILCLQGRRIVVELIKPGEGSKNFKEQPYRIVWALQRFATPLDAVEQQEILPILKEALTVFGYDGIYRQAPGVTEVLFKF